MASSYIYIDIYIDIYITFTNWQSIHSFYWTLFLKTLSCKAPPFRKLYSSPPQCWERNFFSELTGAATAREKYAKSDLSRREIFGQVEL